MAAVAGVLGLVGYALGNAGAYAVTQRMDPTLQTVVRNRYILGGLIFVGGLLLVKKSPMIGAAVAAGGIGAAAGTQLSVALGNIIDLPTQPATPAATATTPAPAAAATTQKGLQRAMGAVFANNMRGMTPQMAAVYAQNMRALGPRMGAVYANNMMGMGAGAPLPNPTGNPWAHAGPFGYGGH